jgi:hypothetical protein
MINYGLFARNAKACENAKHPKCTCVCGGRFHGQSHADVLTDLWNEYVERERTKEPVSDPAPPATP